MAAFGPSAYERRRATVANQFAAMPSLHVGWALLIAVVVVRTARSRGGGSPSLHPRSPLLVVVVTANHYWVDAIVAALLLLLAIAVTPQPYAPSPVAAWWSGRRRARAVPAPAGRNLLAAPAGIPKPAAGADDRAADTRLDTDEETDPRPGSGVRRLPPPSTAGRLTRCPRVDRLPTHQLRLTRCPTDRGSDAWAGRHPDARPAARGQPGLEEAPLRRVDGQPPAPLHRDPLARGRSSGTPCAATSPAAPGPPLAVADAVVTAISVLG